MAIPFYAGETVLTIYKDGALVASVARPVAFDKDQAFEFFTYGGAGNSVTIAEVSYPSPPAQGTVVLLR